MKDLCTRLQYKIKAHYKYYDYIGGKEQLVSEDNGIITAIDVNMGNPIKVDGYYVEVEYVKPYLRPMSSMTEEEREEYIDIKKGECNGCVLTGKGDPDTEFLLVDWLNSHHFDYRGLIEKGLAIEAPEGLYK